MPNSGISVPGFRIFFYISKQQMNLSFWKKDGINKSGKGIKGQKAEYMAMRMSDIAKLAGVSKSTVSRAFSRPEMLQKETLDRIMAIARIHDYRPNTMAQAIARHRFNLVGFLLLHKSRPFFDHSFYGPALDGFMERAKARGYHVVLGATTRRNDYFEEGVINDCIDGALLTSRDPDPFIKVFQSRNIPIVLIQNETGLENVGMVTDNNYSGMMKIMEHLISERGYQNIAFCSSRLSHPCDMQRYFAYIDAVEKHGLKPYSDPDLPEYDLEDSFPPNPVILSRYGRKEIPRFGTPIIIPSSTPPETSEKVLLKLLPFRKMPDAIVCTTDSIAIGVCRALQKKGFRIPQDTAVTGYDDIGTASLCIPSLTTVHVDPYRLGAESMDLLCRYINDPGCPSTRICIDNELVIRESS